MDTDNNRVTDIEEINEKLDELTEMVKENHRMTTSLYRKARIAGVVYIAKWLIIVGITVGAFYYIQPFIDSTLGVYKSLVGGGDTKSENGSKFDASALYDYFMK